MDTSRVDGVKAPRRLNTRRSHLVHENFFVKTNLDRSNPSRFSLEVLRVLVQQACVGTTLSRNCRSARGLSCGRVDGVEASRCCRARGGSVCGGSLGQTREARNHRRGVPRPTNDVGATPGVPRPRFARNRLKFEKKTARRRHSRKRRVRGKGNRLYKTGRGATHPRKRPTTRG